jgi:hypothetical protein
MADGEAASFGFPEERAVKVEGTLMSTSAGRRTVADGAALACYGLSASRTRMTSQWPQLGLATPLRSGQTLVYPMPFPFRALRPCIHRLYFVANHHRHLSGIARYPAIHDFASSLAQSQPSFVISSEKVHILSNPADFYTRLTVSR